MVRAMQQESQKNTKRKLDQLSQAHFQPPSMDLDPPSPPPSRSLVDVAQNFLWRNQVEAHNDNQIMNQEIDEDIARAVVYLTSKVIGLEPQTLHHSHGLRRLISRNMRWLNGTQDWVKMVSLLLAKKLNSVLDLSPPQVSVASTSTMSVVLDDSSASSVTLHAIGVEHPADTNHVSALDESVPADSQETPAPQAQEEVGEEEEGSPETNSKMVECMLQQDEATPLPIDPDVMERAAECIASAFEEKKTSKPKAPPKKSKKKAPEPTDEASSSHTPEPPLKSEEPPKKKTKKTSPKKTTIPLHDEGAPSTEDSNMMMPEEGMSKEDPIVVS